MLPPRYLQNLGVGPTVGAEDVTAPPPKFGEGVGAVGGGTWWPEWRDWGQDYMDTPGPNWTGYQLISLRLCLEYRICQNYFSSSCSFVLLAQPTENSDDEFVVDDVSQFEAPQVLSSPDELLSAYHSFAREGGDFTLRFERPRDLKDLHTRLLEFYSKEYFKSTGLFLFFSSPEGEIVLRCLPLKRVICEVWVGNSVPFSAIILLKSFQIH